MSSPHLIILGAGPAGYAAALHAADGGMKVTLVGDDDLGGTCLQRGCIPTKTLVATCDLLHRLKAAAKLGITMGEPPKGDWTRLSSRMGEVISLNVKGIEALLRGRHVTTLPGRGVLTGDREVRVAERTIKGDFVLLATGAVPIRPPSIPFDDRRIVTSDEALAWSDLPATLLVAGGGVIACELAFIFQTLGVEVTVVEMATRPIPMEDVESSGLIAREMKKRKIRFLGSTTIESLQVTEDGVACEVGGGSTITAERALVAFGRRAAGKELGLEALGVKLGRNGSVSVDPFLRTSLPGVYAAGDVTGQIQLAHAASAQAKRAVDHMLGRPVSILDPALIPRVTFTDPEVASIGMTEAQAREQHPVRTGSFQFRALGKAHALDALTGFVKVITDERDGRLLGVHIVGSHASELIHEAVVLMQQGANVRALTDAIHAHPTLSEAVFEAAEDALGHSIHKPPVPKAEPKEDLYERTAG
ncbi:dihydrolipoyl dehydrogenase [Thioalkalivibrio sp. ALJ2]|uniref:dihydrolipoyl dehydrogenase n=1 Tax=Thioalkalivibrio sp. ALJ2 TaxID=1261622 RepID=UPI00039B82C2|nr:dihydrolipoyl dehydrogenase [Thioalkalivibrio sp. ALJ2]